MKIFLETEKRMDKTTKNERKNLSVQCSMKNKKEVNKGRIRKKEKSLCSAMITESERLLTVV